MQEKIKQATKEKGKSKGKCRKIVMPCCRKVAKSIKCQKRRKTSCLKECCPHPSFSECDQAALNKEPASECRCLHFISQCDADQFLGRKQFFNLPPVLPAWPPKERPK
ncbi:hypothetical protein EVAR_72927_1 [Eumeta japonica]|uniref:Uncharacterized protein n=1 Tax=Eumeta variegata TaxID=151549 RepID=A0A4C1TCC6_EUMVA|nr:hypothetical protein EVAR_72927_1 [Eumeta japonica]